MQAEEIFDCSYPDCDYKSIWMENVGCHEKGHNSTKQWHIPCEVCSQIFRSLVCFFYHMSSQHSKKLFCPWCLFLGEDLNDYRTHVIAHCETQSVSTGLSKAKYASSSEAQTPKSVPPSPTTAEGTSQLRCVVCFKSFYHGSSLLRHKKHCNSNSLTSSVHKQAEIHDESQDSIEDPEIADSTDDDATSFIPPINKAQGEGAPEFLIEQVNIEGQTFYSCGICGHKTKRSENIKTHLLVHTDIRPYGCPIEGCKYRAKSSRYLKKHSRHFHHMNLPAKKKAKTPKDNLGSDIDCGNQTENVSSSTNFSMAYACMLCEFIRDSESAALEHAQ